MRPTRERLAEIRREFEVPFNWFCSDWIKILASDLLEEVDALTEELKWRRGLADLQSQATPQSDINQGEVF